MYRNLYIVLAGCLGCLAVFFLTFTGDARPRADFVWNNLTEPQTLDPIRMSGHPESELAVALFEGLTQYHPRSLEAVPAVARRWDVDGLTYTFHLRDDAYWIKAGEVATANGKPLRVTAHDFVWTWSAHAHPEMGSEYAFLFHAIDGYSEYEQIVADEWKSLIANYATEHPDIIVAQPTDLLPEDYKALISRRQGLWREKVGVEAIDDSTLRVRLHSNIPYFTILTSFTSYLPVPRDVVVVHGHSWVLPENIVTNGPYYLEQWRFNSFIRLRKNPHYWETEVYARQRLAEFESLANPDPALKRDAELLRQLGSFEARGLDVLEALAVEEYTTSLNLYLNGDIDRTPELPASVKGDLLDHKGSASATHVNHGPRFAIYYYNLNMNHPAFSGNAGRKLRRALALCVDREAIADVVTRGYHVPAYGLVPPGVPSYPTRPLFGAHGEADDEETRLQHNVARAKQLVSEVREEIGDIPQLKILYNTSETHASVAAFIQADWRRHLSIDCELTNQEWGVYLETKRGNRFDIARSGWIGDYPDSTTFLDLFTSGNPNNDSRYANPFYDRLVNSYASRIDSYLSDPAKRQQLLADVKSTQLDVALAAKRRGQGLPAPEELLRTAIAAYDAAAPDAKLQESYRVRNTLLRLAEEILLFDMPAIPLYFYSQAQLWPPELDGCYLNGRDIHPPKFYRWKEGRSRTPRYDEFPRFSGSDPDDGVES